MIWNLNTGTYKWKIAVALGFLSVLIRFLALNQTSYANGWDGYYYVMQAHSLIEYGHLQSLDYSLIYPYFTFISYLIGDYELAFKIGAAILAGGFTYLCFSIIYRYSGDIRLGVLGACYSIFSPGITFLTAQFPKNLLGIIFLACVAFFILKKQYLWIVIFVILTFLTHRMTAGLSLILIVVSMLHKISWKYIFGTLILLIIISFLPGILHWSDLQRFEGELNMIPNFTPFSFYKLGITNDNFWWNMELIVISALIITFIFLFIKKIFLRHFTSSTYLMLLTLLIVLIFPFFVMHHGSMGYRFFLVAPFLVPFLLSFLLKNVPKKTLTGIASLFVICSFSSYESYNPKIYDAPNRLYHSISTHLQEQYNPVEYPLVIVHKSLAEVIIYKTEFDALNWAAPANFDRRKVLRVVNGIPYIILKKYLKAPKSENIYRINSNYVIMPELTWNTILKEARVKKDHKFAELVRSGNNPMEQRPEYLLKGKKL